MKLRLKIIGPAVIIILAMGVLAIAQPDLLRPLTIAMFIVFVVALSTVGLIERSRRRRDRPR